ncbi:transcription elongation factor GreB [Saccharicrinis carchari]|uniref:Transcription elongation factor GreB n=1 Tax=Saccharicrinis carchari TaxID=1168039 RepID=A0A521E9L9_SACCC|nr:GreA/GreB family elongation factor [Saccharicrinis carchari]SMO80655.1 transcription elongation factor GreB [Saccharicrinis carchari]
MSRGFVKEDDQEETPIVPERADLPRGVINYVTQAGMEALLDEKDALIAELSRLDKSNEKEYRISFNHINAKLRLLNSRIAEAKIVDQSRQPKDEVRFGAWVTLRIDNKAELQSYQIVGVDEANISKKKISFVSPVAKVLLNKKVGDKAILKLANGERVFEIVKIAY